MSTAEAAPVERCLRRQHRLRVIEAMLLLLVARVLVACVPFRYWRKCLGTAPGAASGPLPAVSEDDARRARRIGRAIGQAARYMPISCKCLPQAMAAAWMLQCRSIPGELAFGVHAARNRGTADALHAWVTCGDQVIVEQEEISHTPLFLLRWGA